MTPAVAKVTVPRSVFFILFTISGFAGLIYESIWSHYLKLFLGHAAYSQTLVLAIFMGGMAIGARICAGYTDRWKNLLLGYAIAELAIGFLALIFHGVFVNTIQFAYEVIFPALGSPESINAVKWTIGGALILPQSILLGMTFPLMTAAIMRIYPQTPGSALSMLYFTNSFGAAVGVLASGFYLIEKVGMPGTLLTAGLMNVVLALVVWAITKFSVHDPKSVSEISTAAAASASANAKAHPPQLLYLLLGASLLTGAASFCYEIGWIRMLSLVLGSSTHAFEIMLSAFILGIALGGLWIKRRIDSYANVIGVLALVLVAKGIFALATLPVYGMTFDAMQMTMTSLAKTEFSYGVFNLISHLISLSVMFPAAFCAGMSLPLITFALLDKGYGESSIGKVYAWNTLGAIVGVLFAVHIAMPSFGLKNLIVIAAVVDIGIAIVLGARISQVRLHKASPWAAGLGVAAVLSAVLLVEFDSSKMASGVYRLGRLQDPQKVKILYHRDGKTASIDVVKDANIQAIITNGKTDAAMSMDGDASIADESTMVLAGALPLAHKPNAKKIANIGFGSGLTTHTLLGSTSITSVDTIEIEPAMVEGARLFGDMVERAYTDPRSRIHIEDAKSFFAGRKDKYDIIVSEPSNPWVSGVSGLFSNEFYTQIKRHLQDDGVLVQWIQLYEIDIELVSSILKALGANFEDYVAYEVGLGDMVIMAVPKGKLLPLTEAPFQSPLLKAQLARLGIQEVRDLEMRRIGGKKFLQHLVQSYNIPANSDYFPVVDLKASKLRFLAAHASELFDVSASHVPIMDLLEKRSFNGLSDPLAPSALLSHRPRRAALAQDVRSFLLSGNVVAANKLDQEVRVKTALVREALILCVDPELIEMSFDILYEMGPLLSSQLPAAESADVWKAFENAKCYAKLPPSHREWISLFKAMGNRQAGEVAKRAESLFALRVATNDAQKEYLLTAGMAGHLTISNKDAALAMWRNHGRDVLGDRKVPVTLRLLLSIAQGSREQ